MELRRPDGTGLRTVLVTYGMSVFRDADGNIYTHEDPRDPEIRLTIPADVPAEEIPAGTEVWLL